MYAGMTQNTWTTAAEAARRAGRRAGPASATPASGALRLPPGLPAWWHPGPASSLALCHLPLAVPWARPPSSPYVCGRDAAGKAPAGSPLASPQSTSLKGMST